MPVVFWVVSHLLLLLFDATALWRVKTRGDVVFVGLSWLATMLAGSYIGGALVAGDLFAFMALVGQGLFVHGPVVLGGAAWLTHGPWRAALAGLAGLVTLVGIDAYFVEPSWLEVTEVDLVVPDAPRELTIAVLADIQTDRVTEHERRAVALAMAEEPDLVLLPGDLVQMHDTARYRQVQEDLRQAFLDGGLQAPLGVYAVNGNTDPRGRWSAVMRDVGAAVEVGILHVEPEPGVHVTALPFGKGFDPSLVVADHPGLHIVFAHGPDFALGDVDADLLVAGHVHGGQVRLPFVGPLITFSRVPRAWAVGHTEIEPGKHLLVSRGVGMERHNAPRLRFNCRPEVLIIRVRPE